MADTDVPGIDALDNMKVALDAVKTSLGVAHVYDYPAFGEGRPGPALALELDGLNPETKQFSFPTIHVDWGVPVRVWFYTELLKYRQAYRDVVGALTKVMVHFVENPRPNGYGDTLIDASGFAGTVGLLPTSTEGRQLFGGNIVIIVTQTKTHTITV